MQIPEELDDTPIQVSFFLDGKKVTLHDVPRYLHESIKYHVEWRKFSGGWPRAYEEAVKKYGMTLEAVQCYMNEAWAP